ncbi:MAG: hypothetical protein WA906_04575 [Pacificimonas sp.]
MLGKFNIDDRFFYAGRGARSGEQRVACRVDPPLNFCCKRPRRLKSFFCHREQGIGGDCLVIRLLRTGSDFKAHDHSLGFGDADFAIGQHDACPAFSSPLQRLRIARRDFSAIDKLFVAGAQEIFAVNFQSGVGLYAGLLTRCTKRIEPRGGCGRFRRRRQNAPHGLAFVDHFRLQRRRKKG